TSCFFFNDTSTTKIYTLSLHDALPIYICSLKTEQKNNLNVYLFEVGRHVFLTSSEEILKLSAFHILWRVCSWLRMNAGGVPNTCKSSAGSSSIILRGDCCVVRAADGCVIRGQPA